MIFNFGCVMDNQAIFRFWDDSIEKLEAYQVKPVVVLALKCALEKTL